MIASPIFLFAPRSSADSRPSIASYAARLTGAFDDFFETNLLSATLYDIMLDSERIGFFALADGERLTAFSIVTEYARLSQMAFTAVRRAYGVTSAYVVTCDELFLSLCMDAQVSIGMKAYFFRQGVADVRAPEWGRALFRVAEPGDEKDILDHYDGILENIRLGKYFMLRKDGVFFGQGFFNQSALLPGRASIGMSVHPDHRQRGVGRSIMLHLAAICRERGLTPYCGCWYFNHNSRRTLESAGFISTTRYLDIRFPSL